MKAALARGEIYTAKIQSFRGDMVSFNGGPVIDTPQIDRRLRHSRYHQPFDKFELNVDYKKMDGEFFYGGPIFHHFGHYMSEMVHRIVPVLLSSKSAGRDWLFVDMHRKPRASFRALPSVFRAVADFFDINVEKIKVINSDVEVDSLEIVEQGSDFGGGPKPGYLDDLKSVVHQKLDDLFEGVHFPKKVYVTRSGIPHGGSFLGERYLESLLEASGFKIFHPERESLTMQMQTYRSAETLIFSEGSACHGVELLGRNSLGRVIVLGRRENSVGIFESIFRQRTNEYFQECVSVDVGSVVTRRGGDKPLSEFSVYFFDIPKLVRVLSNENILVTKLFDKTKYMETSDADFLSYIKYHANEESDIIEPGYLRQAIRQYSAAKKNIML
jgi:hypothetical protein